MPNDTRAIKRAGRTGRRSPRQSLQNTAYEAIKHSIITCKLKPGECVNEAGVSAMLGTGRTPVNRALDRLMLEDMVEVLPRKGVIVKSAVSHEMLQMIDARVINETHCARLAAERADTAHIEELGEVVSHARRALSEGRVQVLIMLDREFHSTLASATKNSAFTEVLRKLGERSLRFWFLSFTTQEQVVLQEQHEAIFAAICNRDQDGAEAAMRIHIEAIRKGIARQL